MCAVEAAMCAVEAGRWRTGFLGEDKASLCPVDMLSKEGWLTYSLMSKCTFGMIFKNQILVLCCQFDACFSFLKISRKYLFNISLLRIDVT